MRTDRQAHMTKLKVAFYKFANASNKSKKKIDSAESPLQKTGKWNSDIYI
jgi:hypothetical protein